MCIFYIMYYIESDKEPLSTQVERQTHDPKLEGSNPSNYKSENVITIVLFKKLHQCVFQIKPFKFGHSNSWRSFFPASFDSKGGLNEDATMTRWS
jgi:hypothetical protein